MSEQNSDSPKDDPMHRKLAEIERTYAELVEKVHDVEQNRGSRFPFGFSEGVKHFGKITAAGADANHWKWKFVVVKSSDGSQLAGNAAEAAFGECVVAGGGAGVVGMTGIMVLQVRDDLGIAVTMVPVGGGYFPVIVKGNGGSDGSSSAYASYAYDLYSESDTGYVTKLNLSGALQPEHCYTRGWKMNVTAAADGSVAVARYDTTGVIHLWDCKETPTSQSNCTS